jgi:hypothetical protein
MLDLGSGGGIDVLLSAQGRRPDRESFSISIKNSTFSTPALL